MEYKELTFPDRWNEAERFVDYHVQNGRGDKPAIYYKDEVITYKQVLENVNRAGNAFKSLGVKMENRVLNLALDCPAFVYTFFGAMKIGAVPIPTNTMLVSADYQYICNDSRAKVVVVSKDLLPAITAVKDELMYVEKILVIDGPAEGYDDFMTFISGFPTECETAPTGPNDMAFWLYTSGTTGFPKGAVHLHHDMSCSANSYGKHIIQITENDRTLSVARLFFAYGLGNNLFFPFYVGASIITDPGRPLPDHMFSLVDKYKPTIFFGVPTSYNAMLQVPDAEKKYDLSSVRIAASAGEALPGNIYLQFKEKFGIEILDGIGSTEILHIYVSNEIGKSKPNSTGKIVPGYEAKIVDPDGNELPDGESGILWIKGESTASQYWNKHEKTKGAFVGEWYNTGDQYVRDAEGFFTYDGRGDDMIKAGGIWVSPVEVEACLMTHPAVLEAGVVGVEDEDALIKPKAFIVFKEGINVDDALMEEVKLYVKKTIAPFKFPRWMEQIDELPKTATGKIQRYKLRDISKK